MAFPLFHVAGFGLSCYLVPSGCTLFFGYPRQPPSVGALKSVLKIPNVDSVLLPTSIIDELSSNADLLKVVLKLWYIFGGGGSIYKSAGDIVEQTTRLFNGLGSTECGSFIQYQTDPTDWAYYHFHPWNRVKMATNLGPGVARRGFRWRTKDVFREHSCIPDYRTTGNTGTDWM
ncbi:hypothetical protein ASPACDRAFT_127142, partial [Aspergillus aculeatus ATCC 16872]